MLQSLLSGRCDILCQIKIPTKKAEISVTPNNPYSPPHKPDLLDMEPLAWSRPLWTATQTDPLD